MKTKEELNALKAEVIALSAKLSALTEEEQKQVTGGLSRHNVRSPLTDHDDHSAI